MQLSITICAVCLLFNIQLTICQYFDDDIDPYDDYDSDKFIGNIDEAVNKQLKGLFANLDRQRSKFDNDLQHQLKGLEGLGEMIEKDVKVQLEPVDAIVIKSLMAQGVGGATIATYGGKTKLVLINKERYNCTGKIYTDQQTKEVKCTESFVLVPRKMDNIDVCTNGFYSQVNELYCFGEYTYFQCINSNCKCIGGTMYTLDSLRKQCGARFGTNTYVKYQYQANITDPSHIQIPNPNKYVTCEENEIGSCTWYGNQLFNVINDKK